LRTEARRDLRQPPHFASRHGIAFFTANPHGSDPLQLGEEVRDVLCELQRSRFRDDFHYTVWPAATVDDLIRQIDDLDPTVIHLSGHGGPDGVIVHDELGGAESVSPRALAAVIRASARRARVVVLNACSTTAHAFALQADVDAVIAMDGEIGDRAARMFAARFYGALGNRRSIGDALAQGVAKLAAKRLPDELLPRCVTRGGVDPRTIFLSG
jgi:hypothetical protein